MRLYLLNMSVILLVLEIIIIISVTNSINVDRHVTDFYLEKVVDSLPGFKLNPITIIQMYEKMEVNYSTNLSRSLVIYNNKLNVSKFQIDYNALNSVIILIISSSNIEIDNILQNYYLDKNYEYQTIFILYIVNLQKSIDQNMLVTLFKKFWINNILRVVIFCWSRRNMHLQWFSYDAILNQVYDETSDKRSPSYWMNSDKYDFGRVCLFSNHPWTTIWPFVDPPVIGIDVYTMEAIIKSLHADYNYTFANLYNIEEEGCQILFTRMEHSENIFKRSLNVIQFDYWTFLIDKPERIINMIKYFKPFQISVWYTIFGTTIFITVSGLIHKFFLDKYGRMVKLFHIFGILFNQSIPCDITNVILTHKIFVILLLCYNILLSSAYLGILTSNMMLPLTRAKIRTLEDVVNHGEKINVHRPLYFYLLEIGFNDSELFNLMYPDIPNDLATAKVRAVLRSSANLVLRANHIDGFVPQYLIEDDLMPTVLVHGVANKFPFSRKLDRLFRFCQEAGLNYIWKEKFEYKIYKKIYTKVYFPSVKIDLTFKLYDLAGIFLAWGSGIAISTLAFIFEVLYYKLCKRE